MSWLSGLLCSEVTTSYSPKISTWRMPCFHRLSGLLLLVELNKISEVMEGLVRITDILRWKLGSCQTRMDLQDFVWYDYLHKTSLNWYRYCLTLQLHVVYVRLPETVFINLVCIWPISYLVTDSDWFIDMHVFGFDWSLKQTFWLE